MVVIGSRVPLKAEDHSAVHKMFVDMAASGVILLPPGFYLLNDVPADADIVVVEEAEG